MRVIKVGLVPLALRPLCAPTDSLDGHHQYFTFERPFADKIDELRASELRGIRTLLMIRASNTAVAFSLPVLSAVISLCVYIGIGNDLNPAKIFTAMYVSSSIEHYSPVSAADD
jgi:hypothetical protein